MNPVLGSAAHQTFIPHGFGLPEEKQTKTSSAVVAY